jgi:prepilin-type N-terminal cleavage/methylation domain-containing protein
MSLRLTLASQRGMTLVEVTVASLILAVGILGTVSMIDTSNAQTSKTKAREGATSLGRAVLEIARAVPYKDLTPAAVYEELERHPGLEDTNTAQAGHQIRSRNFTYSVTVGVCTLDDPKDRLGDHDEPVVFCPDTAVSTGGTLDRNPDDYRRVTLNLSWKAPDTVTATTKQSGVIANPVGGLGPSVVSLTGPTSITTPVASASYHVLTSVSAKEVRWSVDANDMGKATGGGVNWDFTWNLVAQRQDGSLRWPDCTYVVGANAFDDKDRSGVPKALTVKVNRIRPVAPRNLQGGRNLNGNHVDLQWDKGRECDITSYKVYRGTSSDPEAINTLVCTTSPNVQQCVDESAPAPSAGQTLYYKVVATDIAPDLTEQPGTASTPIAVAEGNAPPTAPPLLSVCTGGNPGCTDIDGNAAPGGTYTLRWDASTDPDGIFFYRVYRKSGTGGTPTYADRYDILFPVSGKPLVFVDDQPLAGTSSYWVSAVDVSFGESVLTGPVTVSP